MDYKSLLERQLRGVSRAANPTGQLPQDVRDQITQVEFKIYSLAEENPVPQEKLRIEQEISQTVADLKSRGYGLSLPEYVARWEPDTVRPLSWMKRGLKIVKREDYNLTQSIQSKGGVYDPEDEAEYERIKSMRGNLEHMWKMHPQYEITAYGKGFFGTAPLENRGFMKRDWPHLPPYTLQQQFVDEDKAANIFIPPPLQDSDEDMPPQ